MFQTRKRARVKPALQERWKTGFRGFQDLSGLEALVFFGFAGDTRHRLGADGRKWSTSSTLRVLSSSPKVTASCIIQHPALSPEGLAASFHFQDLPRTGTAAPPALPLPNYCPELVKMMQTHTEAWSVVPCLWDLLLKIRNLGQKGVGVIPHWKI